jgi:golgi phosphoprotein 3
MFSDRNHELTLPEELLLLALDDTRGSVLPEARIGLPFGLAGAGLMEMTLAGELRIEDGKLFVDDGGSPVEGTPFEAIRALLREKPGKNVRHWVERLPRKLRDLRQQWLDALVARGTLEHRESKVLFIFPVQRYPERDGQPERDIRARIDAVLLHGNAPDARTAMLIQLAGACRLLRAMYPREMRKRVEAREKELQDLPIAEGVDAATRAAVSAAATAAAMAAITAATAASSSAACSAGSGTC